MEHTTDISSADKAQMRAILGQYQHASIGRSAWQLANTLILYFVLWVVMVWSLKVPYFLTLGLVLMAAGFLVHAFIIFHDSGNGSFFKALPNWQRVAYRIMRNPLIMFTIGSFRVFMLIQVPVMFFAASAGVWLIYVQHNFVGSYWVRHEQWDFYTAGLKGSSFYQRSALLQWFTGNIGFHPIHHLNARIPNYLLSRCYGENPIFQVKPLTIRTSLQSLRLRLWDEQAQRMVGFEGLR